MYDLITTNKCISDSKVHSFKFFFLSIYTQKIGCIPDMDYKAVTAKHEA